MNNSLAFSSKDHKRSRAAYTAECAFEYFVSILVTDAFLASLLEYIGLGDSVIGIISSLITFAFLFQLLALYAVKKIVNTKRASIIFHFTSQIFFMSLYLVPFFPIPKEYKAFVVVGCILIAYLGNYLVTSVIYKWGMTYVDPSKRARFSATKEMISLISGMFFTLIMGFAVDKFAEAGNVKGGFIFVASAILVSSVLDLICLLLMKNIIVEDKISSSESIFTVIKRLFKNRSYVQMLIITVLWNVAVYFTMGFMGIYKTKDLALTVGTVQIINIAGCLARFLVSRPFGKFSDKHSYTSGMCLGFTVAALAFAVNIFTSPGTWWMVVIFTLLYNMCLAGVHQNMIALSYDFVEEKYFVQATAIKAAVGGIFGFFASLLAGRIVSVVQDSGNMIFGIEIRAQQLLSLISAIIIAVLIVFVKAVFSKQKKIDQ